MEKDIGRKDFLKKGFFQVFNFFQDIFGEVNSLSYSPIRPPGAIEEKKFLDTCVKCGSCISACGQSSIKFAGIEASFLIGYPIIIPSERPCFACDDLSCMKACPSGALQLTEKNNIKMGTAIVNKEKCITYSGKDCDICVKSCPFPQEAIFINENKNPIVNDSCIGCGLCEYWCEYKAISIKSNR
ncbi:MAG: 4Fe-4S dicluster domain-containing protein [Candidatus Sericytochromatia bacterium]